MAKTLPRTTIILEGPDGAGKSTLGQRLSNDFGYEYIHTGGAASTLAVLITRMADLEEQAVRLANGRGAIFDRVPHISDAIYKKALGLPYLSAPKNAREYLKKAGRVIIIYCRLRDSQQMLSNILDAKKDHKPPEYLEKVKASYPQIVEGYDWEMSELREAQFPVIQYDWTSYPYPKLVEELKSHGVRPCAA